MSNCISNQNFENLINCVKDKKPVKVLFVCLGNICRSPAAEGIMLDIISQHGDESNWIIDSAGTGNYHIGQLPDNRMRVHARRRGIELEHICRQVKVTDFEDFDLIIPMDASNESNLLRLSPSIECDAKIIPMANFLNMARKFDYIPDPYYDGADGFELVLDLLQNGCENLYEMITQSKKS